MTSPFETNMSQFSPEHSPTFFRPGPPRSRTQSMSSDKPSTVAQSVMSPPISVSPEAAFIAAPSASQIVTNDHDNHADAWYDQHGVQSSGESVEVSDAALHQLNSFLDHLLFNFLALAGSTSLPNLRPAVSEVLKPKLAKDAISNADEELREYLGGDDDDEFLDSPATTSHRDWDLELAWKRARLRCMVYSSLGDMEEEDEDRHMEEGLLSDDSDETSGSSVTPAVAIFLTSILEYLGEQALVSAGQAAWNRMRSKHEKEIKQNIKRPVGLLDKIAVEEVDMERVALDRTLGRLWRAWKKRVRSGHASIDLSHRPASREKMYHQRLGSLSAADSAVYPPVQETADETEEEPRQADESTAPVADDGQLAATIPLPMGDRDVDEIECPGLAYYSDEPTEEDDEPEELTALTRPKSLMIFSFADDAQLAAAKVLQPTASQDALRRRANSLPPPVASAKDNRIKIFASSHPDQVPSLPEQDVAEEKAAIAGLKPDEAVPIQSDKEAPQQPASEALNEQKVNEIIDGLAVKAPDAAQKLAKDHDEDVEDDDGDSVYEEIEEAQILTSSRISIGGSISGRSDSPSNSDRGSRPPLSIHLPVRTGSLRLVDVSSPRTPSTRSQRNSLLQAEGSSSNYSRSVSRNSSINPEELREADESRGNRLAGPVMVTKTRGSVAPSISEAEELGEPSPMSATLFPRRELQSEVNPWEQQQPPRHPNHALFGSIKRQPPVSPPRSSSGDLLHEQQSPRTKDQPSNTSPTDEAVGAADDVGPLPTRFPRQTPRSYNTAASPLVSPMSPAVPEKSSSRYQHSPPQGPGSPSGSIGVLSVHRPVSQRDHRDGSWHSPEQSNARKNHTPASSASSHKLRAARGSQDSTATQAHKNFEELMQSNDTIQYTLTPDNMRELEQSSPRSIQSITQTRTWKGDDARQANTPDRPTLPSPKLLNAGRSNSVTHATGLRSHPVELPAGDVLDKAHPPVSMSTRASVSGPQARDARLPRESVLEFADFIRATGPAGAETGPVAPLTSLKRNPSLMRDQTSMDQSRPSLSGSISKARLQARDATVNVGNDNSDLIDFIRQGPPNSGNHRIPRAVAPFRTTMDSDQLAAAIGGRARDASLPDAHDMRGSQASTNITEMSAPSVQSSVNSQSALLGRTPVAQSGNPFDEPDLMPVRKQHRVRDPYAIDLSDEDDDDDDFDYEPQPSRKAAPKEESLIDFLNSAPPPPPSDPVPFNLKHTQSMPIQTAPPPKKKASTPSLIARFRQNSSMSASSRSQASSHSVSSRSGPPANKGYVPIQVNIPTGGDLYPSYGSTIPAAGPSIPSQYPQRPSGRVPMKKFEPRDATSTPARGTSDLADFLRSEPPPMSGPPSWSVDQDEGSGSNSKLFGRRKKRAGFA